MIAQLQDTYAGVIKGRDNEIAFLRKEVETLKTEASLKRFLERQDATISHLSGIVFSSNDGSVELSLPDDVLRYVPDFFGGQVVKQEATRVVKLDKSGNATYHFTKKEPNKGFSYLLVREK